MNKRPPNGVLDDLLDPLSRCFNEESARRLTEFRVAPLVQKRIGLLAERANEGILTPKEQAEYETIVNAADFISILRLKAARYLKPNSG